MRSWLTCRTGRFAALLLLLGCEAHPNGMTIAQKTPVSLGPSCSPAFSKVSDEPMEVWSGYWKIGFDTFLIGCAKDLKGLTPKEARAVAARLQQVAREQGDSPRVRPATSRKESK